eukprot:TRINITY_DN7831_c0_g1_i2.p3 TRINITY_DN7831_c0_g1~~TRINITY_DN7831_c0_g1_i2.p3  ORF type:complete len:160 (+),score=3.31 TRINITY_DN7831_c0_g1_i2:129-608(+)
MGGGGVGNRREYFAEGGKTFCKKGGHFVKRGDCMLSIRIKYKTSYFVLFYINQLVYITKLKKYNYENSQKKVIAKDYFILQNQGGVGFAERRGTCCDKKGPFCGYVLNAKIVISLSNDNTGLTQIYQTHKKYHQKDVYKVKLLSFKYYQPCCDIIVMQP